MEALLLRYQTELMLIAAVAAIVAVVFAVMALGYLARVRAAQKRLLERVSEQDQQLALLAEGERGVGRRVVQLGRQLQQQQSQPAATSSSGAGSQFDLAEAEKLVYAGATADDLVRTCHLSPADAELLIELRRGSRVQ